jgi:ribose-phosphate pyrophosphokinase
MRIRQFADGEIHLRCEETVRGADAYVIQPTCFPVNDRLVELLICLDALRRASAFRITAVIPYFGYARQEKKDLPREPITAKLVADLLQHAGANRVMAMDLHADAIQGFFCVPVDHLTAANLLARELGRDLPSEAVVVSPDEGGVKKARRVAATLGARLAVAYHQDSAGGGTESYLAGDVEGRSPIVVEDMITTGRSVAGVCDLLLTHGCRPDIRVAATHAVLAGDALERLAARAEVVRIVVTDTIPVPQARRHPKLTIVSVAGLFSEAIRRANHNESISSLFRPSAD